MALLYTIGDSLDVLKKLPDQSVDLALTSTPYLRKVQYADPEGELAELEIGHEETPAKFVGKLLDVTDELSRILTPGGSIAFDIGDSFAGSGGAGGDYNDDGKKEGKRKYEGTAAPARRNPDQWPRNKSLCGIPEAFRLSLMYGRNILTDGELGFNYKWIVRNVVRLCSENPPRGRQADKFTPAVTEVVVATLSGDRYWNEDHPNPSRFKSGAGRAMDWWIVKQKGLKGHPAVWPEDMIQGFITALCPRSGVVLDPFAGSGRTIQVASDWGRHGVGIELNAEYLPTATAEVGMYLEHKTNEEVAEWLAAHRDKFQKADD